MMLTSCIGKLHFLGKSKIISHELAKDILTFEQYAYWMLLEGILFLIYS